MIAAATKVVTTIAELKEIVRETKASGKNNWISANNGLLT